MRFLICIDFLMNLVKQSFKETLWFSQPLQDSPGEIVVFGESLAWLVRGVLRPRETAASPLGPARESAFP